MTLAVNDFTHTISCISYLHESCRPVTPVNANIEVGRQKLCVLFCACHISYMPVTEILQWGSIYKAINRQMEESEDAESSVCSVYWPRPLSVFLWPAACDSMLVAAAPVTIDGPRNGSTPLFTICCIIIIWPPDDDCSPAPVPAAGDEDERETGCSCFSLASSVISNFS